MDTKKLRLLKKRYDSALLAMVRYIDEHPGECSASNCSGTLHAIVLRQIRLGDELSVQCRLWEEKDLERRLRSADIVAALPAVVQHCHDSFFRESQAIVDAFHQYQEEHPWETQDVIEGY
eukprot:g7535.t1